MLPPFRELGDRIDEAFSARDYDERAFPEIAARALEEARLSSVVSPEDVVRWLVRQRSLPTQDDIAARFGQPPVTVFRGRRFYVQVLLWREGATAIHRHGFSGAFTLLRGESLHTRYGFTPRRRVSSSFLIGDVELRERALLGPGDVVPITHDLAHALFHLDAPSATVVVRTFREEDVLPQYNYHPPCLAIDPFYEDPVSKRQLQALAFVRATDPESYAPLAAELAGRSDLETSYRVLAQAHRGRLGPTHAPPVIAAARARHGDVVDELLAALHEDLRDGQVGDARARTTEPNLRFFLALLQNLHEAEPIFDLVARRFPDKPARDTIRDFLHASKDPLTLGADLADEPTRITVDALLDGASDDELFARFGEIYGMEEARREADAIRRHAQRLRQTALGPLFRRRAEG
jgi:hypothetical protein